MHRSIASLALCLSAHPSVTPGDILKYYYICVWCTSPSSPPPPARAHARFPLLQPLGWAPVPRAESTTARATARAVPLTVDLSGGWALPLCTTDSAPCPLQLRPPPLPHRRGGRTSTGRGVLLEEDALRTMLLQLDAEHALQHLQGHFQVPVRAENVGLERQHQLGDLPAGEAARLVGQAGEGLRAEICQLHSARARAPTGQEPPEPRLPLAKRLRRPPRLRVGSPNAPREVRE